MNFLTLNTIAQNTFPHTSNIGYQVRGAYRIETAIPEDRKIGYWYRDMLVPLFATYGIDLSIRLANYLLAFPAYIRALGLDKLTKDKNRAESVKNYNYKDFNSPGVLQSLRERVLNASKGGSYRRIPKLFEEVDIPKMSEPEKKEAKTFLNHLKRQLNYSQYIDDVLVPAKELSQEEGELLKRTLTERAKKATEEVAHKLPQKLKFHLEEALKNDAVVKQLKHVKSINFFPQMAGNLLYSFVILGVLTSIIDVKKIQPWQSKLVEQGYDSNIIMKPAYLSFIPAIGAFALAHKSKALKKLGYMTHFNLTWLSALAVYTASAFLWTFSRIKRTEPQPPLKVQPKVAIPQGFKELPLSRPNRFSAFSATMTR